ncbi:MAG: hypothetical protein WA705_18725, partial [Candidatus Ozemobacteraceae bacterium]
MASRQSGVRRSSGIESASVKFKSLTQLMAIRRSGLQELAQHLRKLFKASPATISRQRVLLCVDDATEKTRGVLGSLASLIW